MIYMGCIDTFCCRIYQKKTSTFGVFPRWDSFLYPTLLAILLSAFFLMPTAMALTGGRGENRDTTLLSLLVPSIKLSAVLYHPYGIGLTTLAVTALLAGITWKRKGERILAWGLIFILTIPLFSYLLNGGLYIRDKVLIPFCRFSVT